MLNLFRINGNKEHDFYLNQHSFRPFMLRNFEPSISLIVTFLINDVKFWLATVAVLLCREGINILQSYLSSIVLKRTVDFIISLHFKRAVPHY